MDIHVMTWNSNGLQSSRTRGSRRMLLRKDLQRNVVGDIDVLMIQEHKIAHPFGNLMRAGFRTFWESASGHHFGSCGVCISVGPRLLSSVRHHGTLVAGRALYVAIDIDGTLVGFLTVYAHNTPRERAVFWSRLTDVLPIVDTWIIGGDFNNIESDSDWCAETRPVLSSISPHNVARSILVLCNGEKKALIFDKNSYAILIKETPPAVMLRYQSTTMYDLIPCI
ncbi:hypothetical protein L7F22_041749 [Adiantum nelumboides]|nr:hypothetical protein [Adiantum nelumboides]